jgi:hypothetical protein
LWKLGSYAVDEAEELSSLDAQVRCKLVEGTINCLQRDELLHICECQTLELFDQLKSVGPTLGSS